jgi:hypothetical protein
MPHAPNWRRRWRCASASAKRVIAKLDRLSRNVAFLATSRGGTWSAMQVSNVLQRAQTKA